jgi:Na+-transporting NADH:ubiquinone oxidoreductase subunit C
MNRDSNIYTTVYAAVMVVLVALILAFTSQALKETQKKNEDIDKMMQMLRSVRVIVDATEAEATFNKLITQSFLVNQAGEKLDGDAFGTDVAKAFANDKPLPVFVATIDGQKKYILSMRGAGLWGPVWGYISLDENKDTVYGADFSHQAETPGLGAEISQPFFSKAFYGKNIFNTEGVFKSIAVVKPGKTLEGQAYVDGISGGTITCQGVDKMLYNSLDRYVKFLKSNN